MMSTTSTSEASRAPWRDVLEQLETYLASTAQYRCLLWVDPAQADPFADNELVEELRVRVPIRHPRFDMLRAPYIVPLDLCRGSSADLFQNSVERAWLSWRMDHLSAMHGQPICGWVITEANATVVARHWGARCHLHTSRRQHRLLRFQDPGVREWLWPALTRPQQQAMLGHATEIISIGRTQQPIHHHCGSRITHLPTIAKDEPDALPTLQIEQGQWDQIDDYATLHAAWLAWRSSAADQEILAQGAGWERPVLMALAYASQLGIRDAVDRELFALHALQMGANFHRSPKLDEVWPQTQAGEFYGSAVESVTGCPADQLSVLLQSPIDSREHA